MNPAMTITVVASLNDLDRELKLTNCLYMMHLGPHRL